VLAAGLSEGQQDFPALPSVRREIETIRTFYGAKVLLDQTFSTSNVEKELQQESFTIVHIASHGTFDRDAAETFLLTYDGKLTMNRLAEVVGRVRFREAPLELLMLSACETAEGDDRAALGLAGVAIKAGARSALATLWLIDDRASSELVIEFYRQLHQTEPAVSRATALRNAQLKLLDGRYKHPGFWAPFLLLNNWL
jgi:CHAT domain-containing protein